MKVLVPMSGHTEGLHAGHKALIEFAKTFGDVTVRITRNYNDQVRYILEGHRYVENQDISRQISDIQEMGVSFEINSQIIVADRRRVEMIERISGRDAGLRKILLLERYHRGLKAATVAELLRTRKRRFDLVVRGPEIMQFALRQITPTFSWRKNEIFGKIVKNKDGIKESHSLSKDYDLGKLRKVIVETRSNIKTGRNDKLIDDINQSYKEDWRMEDATVWEGGFVKGRVEVFSFTIPAAEGKKIFVEDVDYYV